MNVVVLESYAAGAVARLQAEKSLHVSQDSSKLNEAEILLIRSRTNVDAHLLNQMPKLKLVVTATSGFDHIDWRECLKRGIAAAHTPEANAQSAAELTFTLILALERQLIAARKNVRENRWRDGLSRPAGLEGQDIGIIGLGRIGLRVAKLAQAFGMRVTGYDPYVGENIFAENRIERLSLIETLKANDYISLHVPLTKETKHLLNMPTFGEMQGEAILINTCRGPVVDENALLTALDEGTIRGAAMDVIEREPPPKGHRVLTHPKLLLTPHIGAFTDSAWEKASQEAVGKVLKFIQGQPVGDTLPLNVPWFDKT
jgi:phosphoglycerate dehydrogenase-like enzyme